MFVGLCACCCSYCLICLILTEELKHFGPKALNWLLQLYNNCIATMKTPKIWLRSRVIALLKPCKDPAVAVPASSSGDVETSMEVTTNER